MNKFLQTIKEQTSSTKQEGWCKCIFQMQNWAPKHCFVQKTENVNQHHKVKLDNEARSILGWWKLGEWFRKRNSKNRLQQPMVPHTNKPENDWRFQIKNQNINKGKRQHSMNKQKGKWRNNQNQASINIQHQSNLETKPGGRSKITSSLCTDLNRQQTPTIDWIKFSRIGRGELSCSLRWKSVGLEL